MEKTFLKNDHGSSAKAESIIYLKQQNKHVIFTDKNIKIRDLVGNKLKDVWS